VQLQFAVSQGFVKENLLVEDSEREGEWLKNSDYKPIANIENHDTIGMIALMQMEICLELAPQVAWRLKCMVVEIRP
jgi:hypothetical protein